MNCNKNKYGGKNKEEFMLRLSELEKLYKEYQAISTKEVLVPWEIALQVFEEIVELRKVQEEKTE